MENFTSETAYSLFHKLVKRFQDGCFSKMLYAVQQKDVDSSYYQTMHAELRYCFLLIQMDGCLDKNFKMN